MNPIALLQATVPKNHTAHNVDMAKGLESEGSFFNILGHMLTSDINTEELQMEAEQHMDVIRILALFNDITEDGFDFSSFAGEEGIEELLAVLPEKWQAHLLEILAENELTEEQFTSFPIIEQLIVLLVMMEFSEDGIETTSGKKNESWNELKQLLSKHMPQLSVTATADQLRNRQGNETSLLQHVITHIEETLSRSEKQHQKTFVQALADRKKPTMTLPSLPHVTTNVSSSNTTTSFGHEFNQMMTRAEQATIHLGEHLPKEVQEKQFIRQFQTILQRGVFLQTPQGLNTFSIKLFPEHLGRLDIQLSQMNGEIVAKILTSSTASKKLIESQLVHLRHAFTQQNIPVERIEVGEQLMEKEEEEKQHSKREHNERDHHESEEEGSRFFGQFLNELTFNEQV